jgi:hypothetical protein
MTLVHDKAASAADGHDIQRRAAEICFRLFLFVISP